eukprot:6491092-Amphidinium_carterae.4
MLASRTFLALVISAIPGTPWARTSLRNHLLLPSSFPRQQAYRSKASWISIIARRTTHSYRAVPSNLLSLRCEP